MKNGKKEGNVWEEERLKKENWKMKEMKEMGKKIQ